MPPRSSLVGLKLRSSSSSPSPLVLTALPQQHCPILPAERHPPPSPCFSLMLLTLKAFPFSLPKPPFQTGSSGRMPAAPGGALAPDSLPTSSSPPPQPTPLCSLSCPGVPPFIKKLLGSGLLCNQSICRVKPQALGTPAPSMVLVEMAQQYIIN